MLCTVIIVARNAARSIGECLLATLSQSLSTELYEIIVVDDGSTDSTGRIARRAGAPVIHQLPRGTAAARNAGTRAALGDILVFLDSDCVPTRDWLARLTGPFSDPSVAGVRGAYRSHEEGVFPRLVQAEYDETYRQLARTDSTGVAAGGSAAYRRNAFFAARGFDPSCGVADDLDLAHRLNQDGHRVVFAPRAEVLHRHGNSVASYVERQLRTGLWQAVLGARHADRAGVDALAGRNLRAQIPLAAVVVTSLLLGARWRRILPVAGVALVTFASSASPSAWRARHAGADVALAAPGLRFVSVLSLATGLAAGRGLVASQRATQIVRRLVRSLGRN